MRAVSGGEAYKVVACELQAAIRASIGHDLYARHSLRIELVIPGRIERVGPIDPLAVAADLHHLRTAGIGLAVGVRRAARDAADMHRARQLGLSGIADVVLPH